MGYDAAVGEPERGKSVIGNAAWIVGCKVAQAVMQLIVTMLTARYLGPTYYGLLAYATSVVAFAVPIMQLGLRNTMIQELVSDPTRKGETLGTSLFLNFVSSLCCVVGVCCFAVVSNPGDSIAVAVCALCSATLVLQAIEVVQYWFQERLMSKYISISMLVAYFASAVFQIALLVLGEGVLWFAAAQSLQHAVIAVSLVLLYHKKGGQRLRVSLPLCGVLLSRSKHFILSNLMITVFMQTDKVMIEYMMGSASVGFYTAAATCANMTNFVFLAVIDSCRPVILDRGLESSKGLDDGTRGLSTIIILLSFAQAVVLTLFADLAVGILYGEDYFPAVAVLRILIWGSAFAKIGLVRDMWVLAKGQQSILWKVNMLGAILNVALNVVFIPLLGIVGAAASSLAAQFLVSVLSSYFIKSMRPFGLILIDSIRVSAVKELAFSLKERRLL